MSDTPSIPSVDEVRQLMPMTEQQRRIMKTFYTATIAKFIRENRVELIQGGEVVFHYDMDMLRCPYTLQAMREYWEAYYVEFVQELHEKGYRVKPRHFKNIDPKYINHTDLIISIPYKHIAPADPPAGALNVPDEKPAPFGAMHAYKDVVVKWPKWVFMRFWK